MYERNSPYRTSWMWRGSQQAIHRAFVNSLSRSCNVLHCQFDVMSTDVFCFVAVDDAFEHVSGFSLSNNSMGMPLLDSSSGSEESFRQRSTSAAGYTLPRLEVLPSPLSCYCICCYIKNNKIGGL